MVSLGASAWRRGKEKELKKILDWSISCFQERPRSCWRLVAQSGITCNCLRDSETPQ